VGLDRAGTVAVGVAVAVAVAVAVGVTVAVAVGVGVGVPPPPPVPITPIEKSEQLPTLASQVDAKTKPKKVVSQKEFRLLPQGVPTQLAPLVFETND
jgi:hypothetical protein